MASTEIRIRRPIDEVFEVVCDPTTYPKWLVGARAIVDVDDDWPEIGSSFRHRIGWGPFRVPGSTSVRRHDIPNLLELGAGMGPFGEAVVVFHLTGPDGTTTVHVGEKPSRGLARFVDLVAKPLVAFVLWGRNRASLEQLRELVESR